MAWLAAFAAFGVVAWPDLYRVSGDAMIHFVYADHAASGHWFQFNLGETSAGSTSVIYTVALTALVRAVGLNAAFHAACTACIVAVALTLWSVVRATRRATESAIWAAVAATMVAVNPGLTFNAPQGIEAPFFALAVASFLFRDPAWKTAPIWRRDSIAAALTAALVAVLRPEGVVVLAVTLALAVGERRGAGGRTGVTGPMVLTAAAAGVALAAAGWWQWRWTGVFLPASAYSRLMMARREGIHLGGVWIYPRFPIRLLAYAPLPLATLAAPPLLRGDQANVRFARLAAALLAAIFVLYTFVTGAAHVARYMMFLLPPMAFAATLVARRLWESRRGRWVVTLGAVALVASYGAEIFMRARWRRSFGSPTVAWIVDWHRVRSSHTDDWLRQIDFAPEKCGKMRISYQEVEAALSFDDRVDIVSSDGRVWPVGVSGLFRPDGSVDGARWIETLKPNVLLEFPYDSEMNAAFAACSKGGFGRCRYGGVNWTRVDALSVWVDGACVRRDPTR
jgi:hypothetical protein